MTENALSILIVVFSVHLQQTETSGGKLFIFQHGCSDAIRFEKVPLIISLESYNLHFPLNYEIILNI